MRRLALAGLVGPSLFATVVIALTALEWDFLHDLGWTAGPFDQPDAPWPSSVGLGNYGFLLVLAFLLLGLSVIALAVVLFRLVDVRWKVGPSLVVILAAGFLLSAFRTDYGSAGGGGPDTWNGAAHAAGLTVVILAGIASMFVLAAQFGRDERWRAFRWRSLAAAVLALASMTGTLAGGGTLFFACFLAIVLVWLSVVSARAVSLTRSRSAHPTGLVA